MPYVLLSISIVFEVIGTTMMKLSEGFTVLGPSACTIVAYVVSFSIFVVVLKTVPLGLAYGIWGGAGTALTTLIGCVAWGEPFGLFTGLGLGLVVVGIYLMNAGSQDETDKEVAAFNEAA